MKEEREILRKNREDFIQAKNEELAKLEQATNDLSTRFNAMLQETLNKMKQKIKIANKQWEDENETKMLAKFEDIVNPGNSAI